MNTFREVTMGIREWIPLIFYATSLLIIPVAIFEWRNCIRRRSSDDNTNGHQDAN